MEHVLSLSYGKDSMAMVLLLIEMGRPIDEVIFFNTGTAFATGNDIHGSPYENLVILIEIVEFF